MRLCHSVDFSGQVHYAGRVRYAVKKASVEHYGLAQLIHKTLVRVTDTGEWLNQYTAGHEYTPGILFHLVCLQALIREDTSDDHIWQQQYQLQTPQGMWPDVAKVC
jgi:hypothetical protein